MIQKIYTYGEPVLKQVATEVEENSEIKELANDMRETMAAHNGVGLAAPQIGKSIRMFVISTPQAARTFVNPVIVKRFGEEVTREEGCLSIPGARVPVKRPSKVKVKYRDENWKACFETFEGLAARAIQHEYDHLEGKLITD
jgi:peptide deformylase